MNILAVDDSPTLRDILRSTLLAAGHQVIVAGNGSEALAAIDGREVDLIISDLNMTVMGGFELLQQVRNDPQHAATPFVFLTTETDAELRSAARSAGATAWMVKPFEPASLIKFVERFRL